ncbi:MAG: putative lipid II flippase FtsW [Nitrospinota bacterium]|nr:putative lipid II flippase FtsW [Nitrospinota bacterium]
MPVKRRPDYWIVFCAVALTAIGIVMIFSSSAVIAAQKHGDPYFFLKRQGMWAGVGVIAMLVMMTIDYRSLAKLAYPLYFSAAFMLAAVLVPGVGRTVNGATRWISVGALSFQPAEFAKLALLIFFAAVLARKGEEGKLNDLLGTFAPLMASLGFFFMLIQLQPDLGTAITLSFIILLMFLAAGTRLSYIIGAALMIAPVLAIAMLTVNYRRRRLLTFLDPWEDYSDSGYQIIQSFVALSNGGTWGVGLGESQQKLFFLPEPHTDFIFAIICEELGFVGAMGVLILFAVLVWRGFGAGLKAPERFGGLVALGITFAIATQTMINVSVALGMLPTKGIPLPFISLGGSSLVMWLAATGLLANVSEHTT